MILIDKPMAISGIEIGSYKGHTYRHVNEVLDLGLGADLLNWKVGTLGGEEKPYGDVNIRDINSELVGLPEEFIEANESIAYLMLGVRDIQEGIATSLDGQRFWLSYCLEHSFGEGSFGLRLTKAMLGDNTYRFPNGKTALEVLDQLEAEVVAEARKVIDKAWPEIFGGPPAHFQGEPYALALLRNHGIRSQGLPLLEAFDSRVPAARLLGEQFINSQGSTQRKQVGLWYLPEHISSQWAKCFVGKALSLGACNWLPYTGMGVEMIKPIPGGVDKNAVVETLVTLIKDATLDIGEAFKVALALESN